MGEEKIGKPALQFLAPFEMTSSYQLFFTDRPFTFFLLGNKYFFFLFNLCDKKMWEMHCGLIIYYIVESFFFLRIRHHLACQAKKGNSAHTVYGRQQTGDEHRGQEKPFMDIFLRNSISRTQQLWP